MGGFADVNKHRSSWNRGRLRACVLGGRTLRRTLLLPVVVLLLVVLLLVLLLLVLVWLLLAIAGIV